MYGRVNLSCTLEPIFQSLNALFPESLIKYKFYFLLLSSIKHFNNDLSYKTKRNNRKNVQLRIT